MPRQADNREGAVFFFAERNITSRIRVSWISPTKACEFVDEEMPKGSTVEVLADAAKERWNSQVLSKLKAVTEDPEVQKLLYSNLYGMYLMPTNRTDENPLWQSSEPYYDDIVTFWDTFRCKTPLMQVLLPQAYEEQILSLIDTWRHDGYMPDGRSSNFNGRTQGGSNADNVMADPHVKGVTGDVDWNDGYQAMVKDAEVTPPNTRPDPSAPESSTAHGRGALPDWLNLGFVSTDYTRSVTRAVEYLVNDFALHQVAKGLGEVEDAAKYLNRSRNWRNQWNPQATARGFSGFLAPRHKNGSFVGQDPLSCYGCYWSNAFYQGLPWEYSFNPTHDMRTLIQYMGGTNEFIRRLNVTFEEGQGFQGQGTLFNGKTQVSYTTPYLYHFAGRQDLSVQKSRQFAKEGFGSGGGLPGNSDSGAMQSWLLWNMIGLDPITGQTTFLIGSPWFGMSIDLGSGKNLTITKEGSVEESAIYVQSLKVNGRVWNKNWLEWNDVFAEGGTMEFVLGTEPSEWSFEGELPPSPASE